MRWGRTRGCIALTIAASLATVSCSDGTPAFCEPLSANADLEALSSALVDGDLDTAAAEARRFEDLAGEAPPEIRSDLSALAESVVDIVELLAEDQASSEPVEGDDTPAADPSEVERRREDLNRRFGDLDRRSEQISNWALRECAVEL